MTSDISFSIQFNHRNFQKEEHTPQIVGKIEKLDVSTWGENRLKN